MTDPIRLEREGNVGVIVIDNPPINAGSTDVRRGLLEAVAAIDADPELVAGVLIGAGGTFIAGSDIREFGKPLEQPELPQVIVAIEQSAKPFVAALEGAALGGGYELALGCDMRIAAPGTVVGLPEVTLGMIPGAGGTQRLPRIVGVAKAIELICAGTRVEATEAAKLGMIDHVAAGPVREEAIAQARGLAGKRRLSEQAVPAQDPAAIAAAADKASKAGRGRPPVVAAIDAIKAAAVRPFAEALAEERAVFTQLRLGTEAAALRHLFFAERNAARGPKGVVARPLNHAGVVGAGTMGSGIAAALLNAGLTVTLVDSNAEALARGVAAVDGSIARWRKSGRLDERGEADMRARFTSSGDLEALAACDCAIEAIVEDMDLKTQLLGKLAAILAPDALIASNTSYLDLDALTAAVDKPERMLGLHFFNPAQVMRLLEVVQAATSSDETLATALALAKRMGKQAVVARNGYGFVGNRIYAAYRRQCEFMLEDGAWPEQIDAALEGFGFAMGPFATGDMSGLDIPWAIRRSQAATRDPSHRYVAIPDRLCESGRLGRKTGAGYYRYDGPGRGAPDPEVRALIEAERATKGIVPREFTAAEIVDRVLITMVNEAALLLAEGVARQAADVDVVFVHGYGFPRHEGGPLFWASRQDRAHLAAQLDALEASTGAGFRRGDIDATLDAL